MKDYQELKTLEFLSGAALGTIRVRLSQRDENGAKIPYNIAGKTMRVIVSRVGSATAPVLDKACTMSGDCFEVQITSKDTAGWSGRYACHFALYEGSDIVRRVAYGFFDVLPVPFGGGGA